MSHSGFIRLHYEPVKHVGIYISFYKLLRACLHGHTMSHSGFICLHYEPVKQVGIYISFYKLLRACLHEGGGPVKCLIEYREKEYDA